MDDAPVDFIERLQLAIVGLEIEISRLEGKWKMSQNRPSSDIEGVVEGLSESADLRDRQVAEIVAARRPRTGDR